MSRRDGERLADVLAAADAIGSHLEQGGIDDGLIFDAVQVRLIEIGEAVKAIDADVLAAEPGIPWDDIAGMRDHLATAHSIVKTTVEHDLPPLVAAVERLVESARGVALRQDRSHGLSPEILPLNVRFRPSSGMESGMVLNRVPTPGRSR